MSTGPARALATAVAGPLLAVGLLGACSSGDDVPLAPAPSMTTGAPSSGGAAGSAAPTGSPTSSVATPTSGTRPSTAPTTAPTATGTPTPGPRTVPSPSSGLPIPLPTGASPEK